MQSCYYCPFFKMEIVWIILNSSRLAFQVCQV